MGKLSNIINAMFKYAIHNRLIIHNPCNGVSLPKTQTKEKRVLSVEEQKEITEHAKGRIYENLIAVSLGTGLRMGEALALTWKDVDFAKREISITKTLVSVKDKESGKNVFKFQTPKTKNSTRIVPMQESVFKALKAQKVKLMEMQLQSSDWKRLEGFEDLIFVTATGKPVFRGSYVACLTWIENSINKSRQEYAKKHKLPYEPIPHFYPHAFRHTFATRCFEAGIEAKVVPGYLGHYSIAITLDLYTHVSDDKAHTEMEKLQNLYQNIA